MSVPKKNPQLQSRKTRRLVVFGFYVSFPLFLWVTHDANYGGAPPAGFGWYADVADWLSLGLFIVFVFCFVKFFRSSVGGVFGKQRDERQQAAFTKAYSVSYKVLSTAIMFPGIVFASLSMFFSNRFIPTSIDWIIVVSGLVFITATLPRAVAMWLEPNPPVETELLDKSYREAERA